MKSKSGIYILALAFLLASAVPATVSAAGGGKGSQGSGVSSGALKQNRVQLRDGSCVKGTQSSQTSKQKQGNTYGPGDGTGNAGSGPKDGTGYGAPSQR
jgi:hypothetical protein